MSEKIRLSPSGKVLGDAGPGLQLRLADACTSCVTLAVTTGIAPIVAASVNESLTVALASPTPQKFYRCEAKFTASKVNETTGSLTKRLQVRYTVDDVPGTWETLAQNITAGVEDELGEKLQWVGTAMALGSDLLVPVPDNCQLMEVRAACLATGANVYEVPNGGTGNEDAVYVSLTEYYGEAPIV